MATNNTKTERLLNKVLREVRGLRYDLELVVPTESLDEYKNKKEIIASYKDVRRRIASNK